MFADHCTRMGTVFEISGKIGHSGTILYRGVPNVWEWPHLRHLGMAKIEFHKKINLELS